MAIEVVRRGVRLGVRIALVPAILFGSVCLVNATTWLFTGMHQGALEGLMRGSWLGPVVNDLELWITAFESLPAPFL
jgi:hypothetical protein